MFKNIEICVCMQSEICIATLKSKTNKLYFDQINQILRQTNLTRKLNLEFNYIYRPIFKEAARRVKEAAQSTCAEGFASRFRF